MARQILIVDDEDDIVKVLAVRLKDYRFEVEIAHNAKEALGKIKQKLPDLIMMDIMMPEMNGNELAEHLKENPLTSGIPVVFLSALQSKQDEQAQGNLINNNFIFAKPYDIKEIVAKINQILPRSENPS